MEIFKIILDNGVETDVNGIFYVFNSKYYFIYTLSEIEENGYVKLYVSQVCKEVKDTPTGPVETGYMLGIEISNPDEWTKVQESITKIVEDKKNGTKSNDIQYLPTTMLVNLKIVGKNKFKLMKQIIEDNFKVVVSSLNLDNSNQVIENTIETQTPQVIEPIQPIENNEIFNQDESSISNDTTEEDVDEVIIDYRTKFFEEQEKNQILEEQIKELNEKLENIKNIIG